MAQEFESTAAPLRYPHLGLYSALGRVAHGLHSSVVSDFLPSTRPPSSTAPLGCNAGESARIAEDLRIVAELRSGRAQAQRRFSERMRCIPRILAAINARAGRPLDKHDLEDLAQQTVLIVLRKLGEFRGLSSIEGWAYRICYFEFANGARRKHRETRSRSGTEEYKESPKFDSPDPWRYEDLHRALDRLPSDERVIVHLKHFRELTFEAIAAEVGTKLSTVKARYYRGLEFLRQVGALRRI